MSDRRRAATSVAWRALFLCVCASGASARPAFSQCPDGTPPPCRRAAGRAEVLPAPDPNVVAVLPFRVAGAHASLAYLREGMLDLLATKLTGEGGPRAVDPRAVMAAWRREGGESGDVSEQAAQRVARRLGAGRLISGSVVGTPARVVVTASLLDAEGARRAEATVAGHPDSLLSIADQLTSQLLAGAAGVRSDALVRLTTASLPALRAYLEGQAAYRRGRYEEAVSNFSLSLDLDSTFALAGLQLAEAAGNTGNGARGDRGLAIAWRQRATLPARDRVHLEVRAGPRYPDPSSVGDILAVRRLATQTYADRAELWYEYADQLYHYGSVLGLPDPLGQAEAALRRALALDSTYSIVVLHLLEISALRRDSAEARRLWILWPARDSVGEQADFARWVVATATSDGALRAASRRAVERMVDIDLQRVMMFALPTGVGLEDADSAARVRRRRPLTATQWSTMRVYYLSRGRPRQALAAPFEPAVTLRQARRARVTDALLDDGDPAAAEEAARELSRGVAAGFDVPDSVERLERLNDLATVALWNLGRGTGVASATLTAALASSGAPALQRVGSLVDAWGGVVAAAPNARDRVAGLDSLCGVGAPGITALELLGVARLWERLDEPERALVASRRMVWRLGPPTYVSSFLLLRARMAARLSLRDEAIGAYRTWLALRETPEPALIPQRDSVRAELARLERRP